MKYKEKVESTYTRRVKVRSNEKLERAFSESIVTAKKLYNFSLKYLEATYGYKHLRRWIPTGQSKNYLTNSIKTKFLLKYYNQDKWSQKLTNLNSQSANYIIEETILNFRKHRNKMFGYNKMTAEQKLELKNNKNKNPEMKSWYRMYGLNFKRNGQLKNSIPFKSNGNAGPKIIHHKRVFLPQFGHIELEKSIGKYKKNRILTARLKRRSNGDFELHLTFKRELPRIIPNTARGADWGMFNNAIYTFDNGEIILDENLVKKAKSIKTKICKIQSRLENTKCKKLKNKLNQEKRKLHVKEVNIIDEYYKKLAILIFDTTDLLVIEDLDSKQMRKERLGAMNRGFNKKLALIRPGRLAEIMLNRANKMGKTLVKIDSYMTSQVEFGTDYYIEKHNLDEREWISKLTELLINRDVNAARNILYWGLNPEKHIKLKHNSNLRVEDIITIN